MAVDGISTAQINPYTTQNPPQQRVSPPWGGTLQNQLFPPPSQRPEGDTLRITSATISRNLDTTRAIEEMHSRLNERARGVRETNEALNQVTEAGFRMEQRLQGIIKNFPPFPMESSQRQEILMSYVSLRKELEKLMVPPPPPPVYAHVKQLWSDIFSENGQLLPSAVPRLDQTSSDAAVRSGADTLARTTEKIAMLSSAMTDALVRGI